LGGLGLSEHYKLPTLFWFAVAVSVIMIISVATTTLAYTINYRREKLKQMPSNNSSWLTRTTGCIRLGLVSSALWMIVAVTIYFLGICLYPSLYTLGLTKLYTWRQMTADQFLDVRDSIRPNETPISFIPDYPTFNGARFILFILLPVIVGWILLCFVPCSLRWVKEGFKGKVDADNGITH